nr:MAG TPA: replication initiator protein [Caudoviricetes sp.]
MTILNLISNNNFITLNKDLIKAIGLEEAILLGELASEYDYWKKQELLENGYFYSTIENIEEHTTLSEYKQRKALNSLKNQGLIDIKIKGLPAKRFIKINEEQVLKKLKINTLKNLRTSSEKIKELVPEKLKGNKNINNKNIEKEYIDNNISSNDSLAIASTTPTENKKEVFNNFLNIYNEECTNLPKCLKITEKRKVAVNKCLKEKIDEEVFKQICIKANQSNFLIGENDRGWVADFDFVTRADKAMQILEGKYESKSKKQASNNIFYEIGKEEGIFND